MKSVGVALKNEEKEITGKALLKIVMSRWLNAADIILEMMSYIYHHQLQLKNIEDLICMKDQLMMSVEQLSLIVIQKDL